MRAIRDNETAANAMGKNVTKQHLLVFVLGSAVIGVAGAMMVTLDGQFTPTSYQPLRFTFLIWVMVIAGGSGNNWGAVLGGFLIWFFCSPMDDFSSNWYLFLGHGLFIGIATCLLTIGPRFISSTEVALLVLLESVLAPVLVWLVVGEYPGEWTLYGGAIVLLSLLVSNAISLYQERYH